MLAQAVMLLFVSIIPLILKITVAEMQLHHVLQMAINTQCRTSVLMIVSTKNF